MDPDKYVTVDPTFLWILGLLAALLIALRLLNSGSEEFNKIRMALSRSQKQIKSSQIATMKEELRWAIARIQELMENSQERDRLAERHSRWDHEMIMRLIKAEGVDATIPDPPPLVPTAKVRNIKPPRQKEEKSAGA